MVGMKATLLNSYLVLSQKGQASGISTTQYIDHCSQYMLLLRKPGHRNRSAFYTLL